MAKTEDDLRSAFDRATDGTGSPDALLVAVRILVRELKGAGQSPEAVLICVKQLCGLPLAAIAAGDTDASADSSLPKQISDMMVRAAIDEYYLRALAGGAPDVYVDESGDLNSPR
ncbi:MAG TPA: hypothetical protein VGN73_02830 [Gemmatimonadaceae bacterium]|jgi:hypothetical protein|nr:hypothetical protein [Gemmatimonadaceae bacterium]